jgi:hypothetical protein
MDNSLMDLLIYGECMIHTDSKGQVRSVTPFSEEYNQILLDNTYRVPSIDEFVPGFKFEVRHNSTDSEGTEYKTNWSRKTWRKLNCGWDLDSIQKYIDNGNIRVCKI